MKKKGKDGEAEYEGSRSQILSFFRLMSSFIKFHLLCLSLLSPPVS